MRWRGCAQVNEESSMPGLSTRLKRSWRHEAQATLSTEPWPTNVETGAQGMLLRLTHFRDQTTQPKGTSCTLITIYNR